MLVENTVEDVDVATVVELTTAVELTKVLFAAVLLLVTLFCALPAALPVPSCLLWSKIAAVTIPAIIITPKSRQKMFLREHHPLLTDAFLFPFPLRDVIIG